MERRGSEGKVEDVVVRAKDARGSGEGLGRVLGCCLGVGFVAAVVVRSGT